MEEAKSKKKPVCPRCSGYLYLEEVPGEKSEVIRCLNCGHYMVKSYDGYFDRDKNEPRTVGLVFGQALTLKELSRC